MNFKKIGLKLLFLSIVVFSFTALYSCNKEDKPIVWEQAAVIMQDPLTTDDYFDLLKELPANEVDIVRIRVYDDNFEPNYIPVFFTEHGLMNGQHHLLVPLTEQSGNVFNMLGMVVAIDITGIHATLTRGRTSLTFSEGMISMFINREDVVYLPDMPLNHRGTLFIPFEPILDMFDIKWEIEQNVLIIGG